MDIYIYLPQLEIIDELRDLEGRYLIKNWFPGRQDMYANDNTCTKKAKVNFFEYFPPMMLEFKYVMFFSNMNGVLGSKKSSGKLPKMYSSYGLGMNRKKWWFMKVCGS